MPHERLAANLVQNWRAGDESAARELYAIYAQRLMRIAQRHLSQRLQRRVDGADVVQSVFRSFFQRCADGRFQIDESAQLWRLLVKITITKARQKARHHRAAIRDVNAESPAGEEWLSEYLATEPGPAEATALVDQIESLLAGLPDVYGQILEMRLAGCTVAEIAGEQNVARQTVYRALNLLQGRLHEGEPPDLPKP